MSVFSSPQMEGEKRLASAEDKSPRLMGGLKKEGGSSERDGGKGVSSGVGEQ